MYGGILNDKLSEEYINYFEISKKLQRIYFIKEKKQQKKAFLYLQEIFEYRILNRIKNKTKPYNAFQPITDNDKIMINNIINETKEYYAANNKSSEFLLNLDKIINYYYELINNKKKSEEYKNIDIKITIKNNKLVLCKLNKNTKLVFHKLYIELDNRLKYLLSVCGKKKLAIIILRYMGFGINGNHCSLPINVYKYLYNTFNIRIEGFSSPLNSKLIQMNGTKFCTLFGDTDKYVGSVGAITLKKIVKYSDYNWTLNPPYMAELMKKMYKIIVKAFKLIKRKDFLIIFLIPKWEEDYAYKMISKYKYTQKILEPPIGKHYMNCNGRMVHMSQPVNSMFFITRDKTMITDDKINKLLRIWNINKEDKENQSMLFTM